MYCVILAQDRDQFWAVNAHVNQLLISIKH